MAHDNRLLLGLFVIAFVLLQYVLWLRPTAPEYATTKTSSVFIDNAKGFFVYDDSEHESGSSNAKFDWETGRKRIDEYKRGVVPNPSMSDFVQLLRKQSDCTHLVQFGDDGHHHSICNPSLIVAKARCVIYSIGLSSDLPFERAFQKYASNKCQVVLIDKKAKYSTDYSSINGRFIQVETVGLKQEKNEHKTAFSNTLRENSHFSVSILKLNISEPADGLGNEIEILGTTLLDYDVRHVVMTLNTKPVFIAGILHTFENMGYALYSFELDKNNRESLITSHFLVRDLRLYEFSKFLGKYYTPSDWISE